MFASISYNDIDYDLWDESVIRPVTYQSVVNKYPRWNLYDNQQVNIKQWLDRCAAIPQIGGHPVIYFKTEPKEINNTIANNVTREVVAIKQIMIMSPNNELPSEKTVFTEWDMPLMDDFVIHVVDPTFKQAFGENKYPMQKDYMYFPLLDRIFKINNVQPSDKRLMGKIGWWECYLAKFEDDATVSIDDELRQAMAPYPGMEDAMDNFDVIEQLEAIEDETLLDGEEIIKNTVDEKKAATNNYSNRLVDSTTYVDLKDTENQRSMYSKRLEIVSVNPDSNAFPVTMYNCDNLGQREVAMTYGLVDAVRTSKHSLKINESLSFSFNMVMLKKFNGELFDIAPGFTLAMKRSKRLDLILHNNQQTRNIAFPFEENEYYKVSFEYTKSLMQFCVKIYQLVNEQKTLKFNDIYIVQGDFMDSKAFQEVIMFGGGWLSGEIELKIDNNTIISDKVNPVLQRNQFGL